MVKRFVMYSCYSSYGARARARAAPTGPIARHGRAKSFKCSCGAGKRLIFCKVVHPCARDLRVRMLLYVPAKYQLIASDGVTPCVTMSWRNLVALCTYVEYKQTPVRAYARPRFSC